MSQEQQSKALAPLHQYIQQEQKRILELALKRQEKELIEMRRPLSAAEYAKQYEKNRNWLTTDNYQVWLKGRRKRGIYASWKDDNFLKWTFKELFKLRSMPWIGGGIVAYTLISRGFAYSDKSEARESVNLYPYGYPPGSKLPNNYKEIIAKDIPTLRPSTKPSQQGMPPKSERQ